MHRRCLILLGVVFLLLPWFNATPLRADELRVPVLVYHRFGPTVVDSMTVITKNFESQIKWIQDNDFTIIPLATLMQFLQEDGEKPPDRSVVITVDDGHASVYTDLLPLIRKYRIHCTLFIYPSAISNASYALTWQQIKEIQDTGLVDVQSHTYWHPNFKKDKKRLSENEYMKFVDIQLNKSRTVLEKKLNSEITLLAWPFGIFDDWLKTQAKSSGYTAAFSIERRHVTTSSELMALPRYLMQASHNISRILGNPD